MFLYLLVPSLSKSHVGNKKSKLTWYQQVLIQCFLRQSQKWKCEGVRGVTMKKFA